MLIQNVYTFNPDFEEGDEFLEYLNRVFSEAVQGVIQIGKPVDWLIIKSNTLCGAIICQGDSFEDDLKRIVKREAPKISVKMGSFASENLFRYNSRSDLERSMRGFENSKEHMRFNYLNPLGLRERGKKYSPQELQTRIGLAGYRLDMPR